jgi:hypothetical protein
LNEESKRFEKCLSMSIEVENEDMKEDLKDPKSLIFKEFNNVIIQNYIKIFVSHPQGFTYYLKNH